MPKRTHKRIRTAKAFEARWGFPVMFGKVAKSVYAYTDYDVGTFASLSAFGKLQDTKEDAIEALDDMLTDYFTPKTGDKKNAKT